MTSRADKVDRFPNKININAVKIQNLKSPRAEPLTIFLRFEYNEGLFGESAKFDFTDGSPRQIDHIAILSTNATDPVQMDDLGQKPVLITLFEAAPKDKKVKEDKSTPIAQAVLDMWPLLKGETQFLASCPFQPIAGSFLDVPAEQVQPTLTVQVTIDQPLISGRDRANAAYITLEGLYSPPEPWLTGGTSFVYTATIPIPLNDDKDLNVVFTNGNLRAPPETPIRPKRWPDARGILTSNGLNIPGHQIVEESIEDEQGELRSKDDREFRTTAEKMKPQINWNIERRCFLLPQGSQSLQQQLTRVPYIPIEVVRSIIPAAPKGKKDDENGISYHGVAYIETAPLLYPGATRLRGAYKIVPFNETEFKNKTKRNNSNLDEAMKIANQLFDRSALNTSKKDAKINIDKQGAGTANASIARKLVDENTIDSKSKKSRRHLTPEKRARSAKNESGEETSSTTTEAQQYVDYNSYLTIDIVFDRPIIEKRKLSELQQKISQLVKPRPPYPVKTNSAEKAVEDYQQQIKNVANLVLEEYRKVCNDDLTADSSLPVDQRRRKLLYELNSTGKYFAFKEQLKHSVIKIVREKFFRTSKFENNDEFQTFLSQLYVFLLDEMHQSLNKTLNVEDPEPSPPVRNTDPELRIFAIEAENNEIFNLADLYHKQRIAENRDNLRAWLDYAAFYLLINDLIKAEQCVQECISIDSNNTTALTLIAILNAILEQNENAQLYFETLTSRDPENIVGWTLYAIYQKHIGNETNAEITLAKAEKLQRALFKAEEEQAMAALTQISTPAAEEKREEEEKEKERLIAEEKEEASKSSDSQLNVGSKSRLSRSSKSSKAKPEKMKSISNEPATARKSQDVSNFVETERSSNKKSIYLKAAEFLLKFNIATWAEKALSYELINNSGKDQQVELALARAKLLQKDHIAAELHITQALSIDYENVEAWALWGHVKYLQADYDAAKGRYQRTLLFHEKPSDLHTLYIRLGRILIMEKNFAEAKDTFLRACRFQPTCTTYLGLGTACYRLNQFEDAEEALTEANFLNNRNPEVWAYLTLICLKTKRIVEAEQSYKYALKLDLQAGPLLNEIHEVQAEVGYGDPNF